MSDREESPEERRKREREERLQAMKDQANDMRYKFQSEARKVGGVYKAQFDKARQVIRDNPETAVAASFGYAVAGPLGAIALGTAANPQAREKVQNTIKRFLGK